MSWSEIFLRLGVAALIGALIGLDRELRHKSAGFRTLGIVAIGVALATLAAISTSTDQAAASRVIQGALAGIGFLGAGVIVRKQDDSGSVEGLTTAASVWTSAAIGAACGLGAWRAVCATTVIVLGLRIVGGWAERLLKRRASARRSTDRQSGKE
jgi:putative Mg2+ transporter-C (MgtC) family protein